MSSEAKNPLDRSPAPPQSRPTRARWWNGRFALAVVVLGMLTLQVGLLAGYANRQFLDADRLAGGIDELRRQPLTSAALGRALTDELLQRQPDAVAIRPLIDSVAASVVSSPSLSGPTTTAVVQLQEALTRPGSDAAVLRIADAGAVLVAVVNRISPENRLAGDDVPLELARIGDQSFAAATLALAARIRTASWLLPLLGVGCLAVAEALARERRRALFVAGLTLLATTALAGLAIVAGGWWAAAQDTTTVGGALLAEGWPILLGPLWWTVFAGGIAGLMLAGSAASVMPAVDPTTLAQRVLRRVSSRPEGMVGQIVRSLLIIAAGIAVAVRPADTAALLVLAGAAWLVLFGVRELAVATAVESPATETAHGAGESTEPTNSSDAAPPREGGPARHRGATTAAASVAVVALGAVAALGTDSSTLPSARHLSPGGAVVGDARQCNGSPALCDRRYDEVAYLAAHNAMSTASDPRWFLPEQTPSMTGQLDSGVRALLIDVWPGVPTTDGGVVTAESAYADARKQLEQELGTETVAAATRLSASIKDATPAGPEALYLCHALCELGWSDLNATAQRLKQWLDEHPNEVVTLIIENHVPAPAIAEQLVTAGLGGYVATPPEPGAPWPTLRESITSGRRLVVLAENGNGGSQYLWLASAYTRLVQETPYTAPALKDLATCAPNRGRPDAPLLLMNHWLSGLSNLVTGARQANARTVLEPRAALCRTQRQLPNFVAVNYTDIGDALGVVNRLNDLRGLGGLERPG